jgi:SAM-dependent methyltransferase
LLPQPLKRQLRQGVNYSLDGIDFLLGLKHPLVPPRHVNFVGDGDFEATGDEFYRYFVQLAGLRPEHRVLDLGCGMGRMARPLASYLTTGSYEGLDIVPAGIQWCQRSYSQSCPNFRFQLADVYNFLYNPSGRFQPAEYKFPFADREFDFVFLTSVFTHILPSGLKQYVSEIFRTIRPDGKCLITFFLLNDEAKEFMSRGLSSRDFRFPLDGCRIQNPRIPEDAVAYEERDIRALLAETGFEVENVQLGSWCGRTRYLSYQDIVVVKKNNAD